MSDVNSRNWPDDETLMAFADGMLDASETERVARHIEKDEDARRFVERLIASADLAKVAFDDALSVPESDRQLAQLIMRSAGSKASTDDRNVVPLRPRAERTRLGLRFAAPLAASIALLVGSLAGFEYGRRVAETSGAPAIAVSVGPVDKGNPVADLLERKPSGERLSIAGRTEKETRDLMVIATFRDATRRVCREFESLAVDDTVAPSTMAVACRENDGWRVVGAVQTAMRPGQDFNPAGGSDVSPIDGILKAIGAQSALSQADEDAFLRGGWQETSPRR